MKKRNSEKWYHPKVTDTGWDKDLPADIRRALMLKAHGGDELAAARACQALANVTRDKETRELAARDADELFKMHERRKQYDYMPYYNEGRSKKRLANYLPARQNVRISTTVPRITPPTPRITPKTPRLE